MNSIGHYLKYSLIKNIFLFAKSEGFNMEDFISKFMNSELAEKIFFYSNDHFYNEESVVLDFASENVISKQNNKFDEILVSYFALIYVNFYLETGETPKKIIKYLPIQYVVENYDHFHLLDEKQVIEIALNDFNKRNNALRKQRSLNNQLNINDIKQQESVFVAKSIFSKLYPYLYLNELIYNFDEFGYFESSETILMCKNVKNINEVTNYVRDVNLEKYAFRKSNALKFMFIDENIKLNKDNLNKIGRAISFTSAFKKTILVTKRYCVIFNSIGEYKQYYFVFTSKDKFKAHLSLKVDLKKSKKRSNE